MTSVVSKCIAATLGVFLLVSPFHSETYAATKKKPAKVKVVKAKTAKTKATTAQQAKIKQAVAMRQEAAKEKVSLEQKQTHIQGEISSVKQEIAQKEARMADATNDLKRSEKAISQSNRTLKNLAEKKKRAESRLDDLSRQAKLVDLRVQDAEGIVSNISQAQFINSMREPWKRALVGGNPNDILRQSMMLRYMAKEQDRTIDRLENRQKNIDAVAKKTETARAEIIRIASDEKLNRAMLEQEKANRSKAIDSLKSEIHSSKERYEQLLKNNQELSRLIHDINLKIAEALKLEKKQAKEAAKKRWASTTSRFQPVREEPTPLVGKFGKLKGRLTMPATGPIVAKFNQQREGPASNLPWRGLLIRAQTGSNVVATAPGTVVYSDWMRGFGNLIILNHGSNYLSIYAFNEALFKSVGENVKQGETIASVGNSGGEDAPGLYFELRYKNKPIDPARWFKP